MSLRTPLVDTHCHIGFSAFDEDRAAVLERAWHAGLVGLVAVAVDAPSALRARELARDHPGRIHATAGLHPTEEAAGDAEAFPPVAELLADGGFVAVGETGLDAFHDRVPMEAQQQSLARHLELSLELGLPVVLHCRDAFDEIEAALRPYRGQPLAGVLHCFTGDEGHAERLVESGLHIGVGGIATFKPRNDLRSAVRRVPDDRLLLETDAPWLAPVPHRGRRNEPAYVRHVAECLAVDRGTPLDTLAARTTANAEALFGFGTAQAEPS